MPADHQALATSGPPTATYPAYLARTTKAKPLISSTTKES
jgi:hypothetical protein